MHPCARRGVGIITDNRESLCTWRRAVPFQRRRNIHAVASVLARNRLAFFEGRASQRKSHFVFLLNRGGRWCPGATPKHPRRQSQRENCVCHSHNELFCRRLRQQLSHVLARHRELYAHFLVL